MAVIRGNSGRLRMAVNLNGRLRTTANGFEDRGSGFRRGPPVSDGVRPLASRFHQCSQSSAIVREIGCRLGCQQLAV